MALTLLGATALAPGAQSFLHSVQQFSLQTICTENKMGNQGVGFSHYVGNINNSSNVDQFRKLLDHLRRRGHTFRIAHLIVWDDLLSHVDMVSQRD